MQVQLKEILNFYIGCKFKHPGLANIRTLTYDLAGSYVKSGIPIKLILRKLEDMTEEEKKHVGFDAWKILRGEKAQSEFPRTGFEWSAHQTMYLLKQGFDLWNLIESNQAIDKSTLK